MTAPAVAAGRFLAAVLLGLGAGLVYGFLRPLRRRRNWPADLIFVFCFSALWLIHSFAVCRGDLRLWGFFGLILGCALWESTAGRLLRPLFSGFLRAMGKLLWLFCLPAAKIFKIFTDFVKKLFAYGKKSGTIK